MSRANGNGKRPPRMLRVRPVNTPEDFALACEWLGEDVYHKYVKPSDLEAPRTKLAFIEDEAGPILAFRVSQAIRLDVQIDPAMEGSVRLRRALIFMLQNLLGAASVTRAREIVTSPGSEAMSNFAKGLGFREAKDALSLLVPIPAGEKEGT